MPSSGGSSQPRDQTQVSYVFCIGRLVLYHQLHLGSPWKVHHLMSFPPRALVKTFRRAWQPCSVFQPLLLYLHPKGLWDCFKYILYDHPSWTINSPKTGATIFFSFSPQFHHRSGHVRGAGKQRNNYLKIHLAHRCLRRDKVQRPLWQKAAGPVAERLRQLLVPGKGLVAPFLQSRLQDASRGWLRNACRLLFFVSPLFLKAKLVRFFWGQ